MEKIRYYREKIIENMPPYFIDGCKDKVLLDYFTLEDTWSMTTDSLIVDSVEYGRADWTLGELKTELSIAGTGNYDDCLIDMIEEIDSEDKVWIYTNPNLIMVDALAVMLKYMEEHRQDLIKQFNPAQADDMLEFWETAFGSTRMIINAVPETDLVYMIRVMAELFQLLAHIKGVENTFDAIGLSGYTLVNAFDDDFIFNVLHMPNTVHLHLDVSEKNYIDTIVQVFTNISVASIRLFIFCEIANGYGGSYGIEYGGEGFDISDVADYIPPFDLVYTAYGYSYGQCYADLVGYTVPTPFTI